MPGALSAVCPLPSAVCPLQLSALCRLACDERPWLMRRPRSLGCCRPDRVCRSANLTVALPRARTVLLNSTAEDRRVVWPRRQARPRTGLATGSEHGVKEVGW